MYESHPTALGLTLSFWVYEIFKVDKLLDEIKIIGLNRIKKIVAQSGFRKLLLIIFIYSYFIL